MITSDREYQDAFAETPYGIVNSIDRVYDLIQYSKVCGQYFSVAGISATVKKDGKTRLVAHIEHDNGYVKRDVEVSVKTFKQLCKNDNHMFANLCEAQ